MTLEVIKVCSIDFSLCLQYFVHQIIITQTEVYATDLDNLYLFQRRTQ